MQAKALTPTNLDELVRNYGISIDTCSLMVETGTTLILDQLRPLLQQHGAILGLSFKPNTDDMREAPSITILTESAKKGASFRVYDPIAFKEAKWRLASIEEKVEYCRSEYEAIQGADAVVIITEWNQFRNLDLERVKNSLRQPYFFDLRNIYKRQAMEQLGFRYFGVGQGVGVAAPGTEAVQAMVAVTEEDGSSLL